SVMALGGELPEGLDAEQRRFWQALGAWLLGGRLGRLILGRFGPFIEQRFRGQQDTDIADEAMLVHDRTRYSVGPHTDAPFKVVSLLFYLPADERLARHGTSIYVPKDGAMTCPGGPHYPFERFERMATMPFVPNALFAFLKTDNSFHGVEPVDE